MAFVRRSREGRVERGGEGGEEDAAEGEEAAGGDGEAGEGEAGGDTELQGPHGRREDDLQPPDRLRRQLHAGDGGRLRLIHPSIRPKPATAPGHACVRACVTYVCGHVFLCTSSIHISVRDRLTGQSPWNGFCSSAIVVVVAHLCTYTWSLAMGTDEKEGNAIFGISIFLHVVVVFGSWVGRVTAPMQTLVDLTVLRDQLPTPMNVKWSSTSFGSLVGIATQQYFSPSTNRNQLCVYVVHCWYVNTKMFNSHFIQLLQGSLRQTKLNLKRR